MSNNEAFDDVHSSEEAVEPRGSRKMLLPSLRSTLNYKDDCGLLILVLLISKSVRSAVTLNEKEGRDVYRRADPLRLVGDEQLSVV